MESNSRAPALEVNEKDKRNGPSEEGFDLHSLRVWLRPFHSCQIICWQWNIFILFHQTLVAINLHDRSDLVLFLEAIIFSNLTCNIFTCRPRWSFACVCSYSSRVLVEPLRRWGLQPVNNNHRRKRLVACSIWV